MKMGIKEFRERLGDVARGNEAIDVTHHGRIVGRYVPMRSKPAEDVRVREWADDLERRRDLWRESTPDWRERMAAYGLDADGEPLGS